MVGPIWATGLDIGYHHVCGTVYILILVADIGMIMIIHNSWVYRHICNKFIVHIMSYHNALGNRAGSYTLC